MGRSLLISAASTGSGEEHRLSIMNKVLLVVALGFVLVSVALAEEETENDEKNSIEATNSRDIREAGKKDTETKKSRKNKKAAKKRKRKTGKKGAKKSKKTSRKNKKKNSGKGKATK